jgi:hypothetical protein
MIMKKLFFLFLIGYTSIAFSQAGKSGLKFLNFSESRLVSLGESFVTTSINSSATVGNPSLLVFSNKSDIKIGIMKYIENIDNQFLFAKTELFDNFSIGFHIISTEVPDMEYRTQPGEAQSTFSSQDLSTGLSFAYKISDDIYAGMTAKYVFEKIFIEENDGIAFDLGGAYKPVKNLLIGLSINNIGKTSKMVNESTSLPTTISFGGNYLFEFPELNIGSLAIFEFHNNIIENKTHLSFGGEFMYNNQIFFRLGYISGYESKGLTTGMGLRYKFLNLDYSFVPFSLNFGSSNIITLGFEF